MGELSKIRITFFVAFSTSIGYILAAESVNWILLTISVGVFLLAAGASALNHIQEKETDKLMRRTSSRPLPSGRVGTTRAVVYTLLLLTTGSYIIFLSAGFSAFSLGIFAVIWYNSVYTPLKRKSPLAIIPGSIIGAIPPVIGWIAAGGDMMNPQIIALAFFFFIWQIPHFWLLRGPGL